MMAVLGVSHIAIGVTDIDRALIFYRDALGLTVDADYEQSFPADMGPELHGGRAIQRRQVWLRSSASQSSALALDQLYTPAPADKRSDIYDLGIHHVAFWVADVDAVIQQALQLGFPAIVPHTASTKDYGEAIVGQIKSVFFRDPDGNLVQCDQRVAEGDV
ncbi:MAG: VOC family protein [Spongiibacteraceae bacterium]